MAQTDNSGKSRAELETDCNVKQHQCNGNDRRDDCRLSQILTYRTAYAVKADNRNAFILFAELFQKGGAFALIQFERLYDNIAVSRLLRDVDLVAQNLTGNAFEVRRFALCVHTVHVIRNLGTAGKVNVPVKTADTHRDNTDQNKGGSNDEIDLFVFNKLNIDFHSSLPPLSIVLGVFCAEELDVGNAHTYQSVKQGLCDEQSADKGDQNAYEQRDGKALNRTGTELPQYDSSNKCRYVRVDNGGESVIKARLYGGAHALSSVEFLTDTFEDNDIRVDRHTDR